MYRIITKIDDRVQILNSKLSPPRLPKIISRHRLFTLLDEITKKRLTTVIAGAGFGKTTLIADYGKYSELDIVWYRLDKFDKDLITFLSYLIAGIKKHFPELGEETFKRIEGTQIISREYEAIITTFFSEIDKIVNKDITIILDDYHLIQDSQEINESLEFFIENQPPQLHLIIISRTDPDLHLSRFRARREVIDIKEEDLFFSIPEIEQLYSTVFDISLKNDSIETLYQKTDGWVSGLILFYHSIRDKTPLEIEKLLQKLKGSHRIISKYLEENVYNLQPDETKDFLIKTSIFSRINVKFCNQLLGINNSNEILMGLEGKHLFTYPFDERREWYYYHHLFQDFLQTKLQDELDHESILKLHKDAAILWEEEGDDEEALRHYLIAEQFERAWKLLSDLGRKDFIKGGRLQFVNSYLEQIPDSYLNKGPWIQYTQARILEHTGNVQEAIQVYQRALKTFHRSKSSEGVRMCHFALGVNYFLTGDFRRAEKSLKELLKQVKDNPSFCIYVLCSMIFVSSHLGKMANADQYFNEAMSLLNELKSKDSLALLYFFQGLRYGFSGNFIKAIELGDKSEELCEDIEGYRLLAGDYHLISWSCYYLGHFSKGLDYANKGLKLIKEKGFYDLIHAWLLMSSALNSTALGKIAEAINDGKESLRIFKDLGSLWGEAWASHVLQIAYTESGNLLTAEEYARSGLLAIRDLDLPLEEGLLKGTLAECLINKGQLKDAKPLLEDAERLLQKSKFIIAKVYLWHARFFWEEKQRNAAFNKLILGMQLCEENQHDIWIISEKHWIIPLLLEIFAMGKMRDYIQRIFNEIDPYTREKLKIYIKNKNPQISKAASILMNEIQNVKPIGLRVYCLGKFRVLRGNEEISTERWKSKKAKMLFKYLLYMRSRGYLSKDILMELLWPEEDPRKSAKRLHVALPSLRKTLEPEVSKGAPSLYILREKDSYKLNLGDDGWVDVDEFISELKMAREMKDPDKSILHYLKAEALYRGDFLEEDIYVEWCTEERDRLRGEYMNLLEKIMEHFERKGDYLRCIEYANKYLRMDKYAEIIYQQLMKYYSLIGNKTMIAKTFERCKENIIEEFDTPLSRETEELYQKLVSIKANIHEKKTTNDK